jgi:hypothetical protein
MRKRTKRSSHKTRMAEKRRKQLRIANEYRSVHYETKRAIAKLERVRRKFMNVCPGGESVLGVYHILRELKAPKEAMLRIMNYWSWVKKEVVDTDKFNELLKALREGGSAKIARSLYSVSTVHEVGLR